MLADRGVAVDHTTIFRWIQAFAPELEKQIRLPLRASNGSWRVDKTDIRIKGRSPPETGNHDRILGWSHASQSAMLQTHRQPDKALSGHRV